MSRRDKTLVYLLLTAALVGLGWWVQANLRPLNADGVRRAISWLLYGGAILLGVGIFRRRGSDAVFFDVLGGCTLVVWAVLFVLYGGMDNAAAAGADTAANMLMIVWTSLPLAPLIRAATQLAVARREEMSAKTRLVSWLFVAVVMWVLILVFCGQFLGFVHLKT